MIIGENVFHRQRNSQQGRRARGKRRASGRGAGRMVNPSESYRREHGGHLNSLATSAGPQKWIARKENKRKVHCALLLPERGKIALRSALKGGNDRK